MIDPEEAGTLSPSINVEELQWVPSMSLANGGGRDVGKFNYEGLMMYPWSRCPGSKSKPNDGTTGNPALAGNRDHWVQQDAPDEVNAMIRAFLTGNDVPYMTWESRLVEADPQD